MNDYFSQAGTFLIDVIFGLVILVIMLRFILQWVRADFYNPLSQAIVKLSDPLLKPMRRIIPGLAGLDMAAIVLMLMLKFISLVLIFSIAGKSLPWLALIIVSFTGLLSLFLYVFIFSIIIMAIASWIAPGAYNPVLNLVQQIVAPVMRPIQRHMKPMGGLDLSPMVALILLYLLVMAIPFLERSLFKLLS